MMSNKALGIGVFVVAALGFLVFCLYQLSSGRPTDRYSQPSFSTGNPAADHLLSMSEADVTFVLSESVGEGCSGSESFYMGVDRDNDAFWSVRCANGDSYEVEVRPDSGGSTRVLDCPTLKAVAHVSCFQKFKDQ